MSGCLAGSFLGTYTMFESDAFLNFFSRSIEYAKNYRESPLNFLPISRRSCQNLVTTNAAQLMDFLKTALKNALDAELKMMNKIYAGSPEKGEEKNQVNLKNLSRITITVVMDHKFFRGLGKKLGGISIIIRFDGNNVCSIPIALFDTAHEGTTSTANVQMLSQVLTGIFDERHLKFLGGAFDGAIYDRSKPDFMKKMGEKLHPVFKITSSACLTHANGLIITKSWGRVMDDYGCRHEGEDLPGPNPKALYPDVCWFDPDEKENFEGSFRAFNTAMKLLGSKAQKNQLNFSETVSLLALEDKQRTKDDSARTNDINLRWKNFYFNEDDQLPRTFPLTIIKSNDKKLRRGFKLKHLKAYPHWKLELNYLKTQS